MKFAPEGFPATSRRRRIETRLGQFQGPKPTRCFPATSRRRRIETSNLVIHTALLSSCFPATSRRRRIETRHPPLNEPPPETVFQPHPEEEGLKLYPTPVLLRDIRCFPATSRRRRIETSHVAGHSPHAPEFSSHIQKKKD